MTLTKIKSKPLDFGTLKVAKLALLVPHGVDRTQVNQGFLALYRDDVNMLTITGRELPISDRIFAAEWRDVSLPGGKPFEADCWEWCGPADSILGILVPYVGDVPHTGSGAVSNWRKA